MPFTLQRQIKHGKNNFAETGKQSSGVLTEDGLHIAVEVVTGLRS